MLERVLTIWSKEMLDTLRDRRTLVVMVLVPVLLMPVFTLLPQFLLGGQVKEASGLAGAWAIDIAGAAHSPELVAYLQGAGAEVHEVTGDPEAHVRADRSRVVMVIPPDFQARLQAEQPAEVRVILDDSNVRSSVMGSRLQELLNAYGQQIASQRLAARGLDADLLTPVRLQRENVATEQQMGGSFLGMFVPMFVVLFAFLGGMYTAIDVTAGEKERGTLEPLLTAPVSRGEVVVGKVLAVFVTSFAAVVLSLLSTYAAFQIAPGDLFGARMSFAIAPHTLLWLVVVALPLTLMLSGVEMIICIFARSFKEAQNYITPLQLVLMLPAFVIGFLPGLKLPAWGYIMPALGQMAIFRDLLAGAPVDRGNLTLSMASGIACAVAAIAAAVRIFRRESVLFRA